ncbi:MAG TPA: integration host factor subunit beta, partial [Aquifex aeolicus]|nr:integration host factor subunit beta [Aquifex aeolicus]
PRTGIEIFVRERYVPVFKMGKLIKNHLNSKHKRS